MVIVEVVIEEVVVDGRERWQGWLVKYQMRDGILRGEALTRCLVANRPWQVSMR